jgi:hypothetical protein
MRGSYLWFPYGSLNGLVMQYVSCEAWIRLLDEIHALKGEKLV